MNHHVAALGVIFSLLLTILFIINPGPYPTFAFTFVAIPVLAFFVVFYYLREVLRELRSRDVL